ncbi:cell division protein FtsQ/DivIB [Clostridium culturomicium]|uniref:cell division protein FtsQ/DivIB n=1 Tax=Clostridium culturomicium TaxID=1499683 RepID=UPI003857342F
MTKKREEDYGNYILSNKESILKRKRKIIVMKRTMIILVLLCTILVTLGLTLPEFNLGEVTVSGNEIVSTETVLTSAAIEPDINIFKINTSKIEKILMKNEYIESATVKRLLPKKLSIEIKERKIAFSAQGTDGIYAIDENGRVLGVKETIEMPQVLSIEGIPAEKLIVGEFIKDEDGSRIDGAKDIHKYLSDNGYFEQFPQMRLEVNNFVDYKLYVENAYIKLGSSENMNDKLAKAFSILTTPQFLGMKGYVDVSFKGNPVVFKEE